MTSEEIGRLCAAHGLDVIPVVDADNYCLGIVSVTDLLLPEMPYSKPPVVGGMATPFGVYLTNGSLQAGVGNGALVAAGALMGAMMLTSYGVLQGSLTLISEGGAPAQRSDLRRLL